MVNQVTGEVVPHPSFIFVINHIEGECYHSRPLLVNYNGRDLNIDRAYDVLSFKFIPNSQYMERKLARH